MMRSWTLFSLCLSVTLSLSCSDIAGSSSDEGSVDKTYGSYYDDPYNDQYSVSDPEAFEADGEWYYSPEDEMVIDEALSIWMGEGQEGDLTDGSALVAGPGSGPEVILSCSEGLVTVAAGVGTGALATLLAASGFAFAGVGGTASVPASLPVYATAGGLIGLGLSSDSWFTCIPGLARLAITLWYNGYDSAARGLQSIVRQQRGAATARPARPSATARPQAATAECRPGGRQCDDIYNRYKFQHCKASEQLRTDLRLDIHQFALCELGGVTCADLNQLLSSIAGCWVGRQTMKERCYNNTADAGHQQAIDYAKRDFESCINQFRSLGCGDASWFKSRLEEQARSSYPECL